MITLTRKASEQVKQLIETQDLPKTAGLRVAVQDGGCMNFAYELNFENEKRDTDQVFESEGVTLLVDPQSLPLLNGTVIDFTEGPQGTGFVFDNPNAAGGCDCGRSFF